MKQEESLNIRSKYNLKIQISFYAIQIDNSDLINNIFWTDGHIKYDYMYFRDVICFDTTYKINKKCRLFALFVGVKHHKQSNIFGVIVLYDETTENFTWLLIPLQMLCVEKSH